MQKIETNYGIVFPGESAGIIQGLIKKYGLEQEQDEKMEKLAKAISQKDKDEAFENIPTRRIAATVTRAAEAKMTLDIFAQELQKGLNIPQEKAAAIAKELQEKVLAFAKRVAVEEEAPSMPVKLAEPEVKPEPVVELKQEPAKPKTPSAKDTYREPVE